MDAAAILQIGAPILSAVVLGLLGWALSRNVKSVDQKLSEVATDVRQLASQGARHGEALAGGVVKFQAIEKRLDKMEEKQDQFQADCIACRTDKARS